MTNSQLAIIGAAQQIITHAANLSITAKRTMSPNQLATIEMELNNIKAIVWQSFDSVDKIAKEQSL